MNRLQTLAMNEGRRWKALVNLLRATNVFQMSQNRLWGPGIAAC